jgi:hypothetical protein
VTFANATEDGLGARVRLHWPRAAFESGLAANPRLDIARLAAS